MLWPAWMFVFLLLTKYAAYGLWFIRRAEHSQLAVRRLALGSSSRAPVPVPPRSPKVRSRLHILLSTIIANLHCCCA